MVNCSNRGKWAPWNSIKYYKVMCWNSQSVKWIQVNAHYVHAWVAEVPMSSAAPVARLLQWRPPQTRSCRSGLLKGGFTHYGEGGLLSFFGPRLSDIWLTISKPSWNWGDGLAPVHQSLSDLIRVGRRGQYFGHRFWFSSLDLPQRFRIPSPAVAQHLPTCPKRFLSIENTQ